MTGSVGAGVNRLVHSTVTSLGIFSNTDSFSSSRREQVEYTSVPPGLRAAIPECSSIRCNLANLLTARVLHSLQVRGSPCQTRPVPEHGTSTRTRSKVGPKRLPKDSPGPVSTVGSIFMSLRLRCRRWLRFRLSSLTTNSPCWLHEPGQVSCFAAGRCAEVKHSIPGLGGEGGGDPDASRCVHPGPSILKAGPSLGRLQSV